MITVDVKIQDQITKDLDKIQKDLDQLPAKAHKEFVALTPIDTGHARRRTRLQGDVIAADYAYAQRLDQGWSKQAPQGMTKPWERWYQRQLNKIFGK